MHGLVTRLMVLIYLRSSFGLLVLKTQKNILGIGIEDLKENYKI